MMVMTIMIKKITGRLPYRLLLFNRSANLHYQPMNMSGSGIFESDRLLVYRNDEQSTAGDLLTAGLSYKAPIVKHKSITFSGRVNWEKPHFRSQLFGDTYHFMTLGSDRGVAAVCNKRVCCRLDYDISDIKPGEMYALGAFDGLHTLEGTYYIQVCALLKCAGSSRQGCGGPAKMADTHFRSMNLTGNFSSAYVFPSLATSGVDPALGQWRYDGSSLVSMGTKKGLLWATLLARVYDRDNVNSRDDHQVCSDTSGVTSAMLPSYENYILWLFAFRNVAAVLVGGALLHVFGT